VSTGSKEFKKHDGQLRSVKCNTGAAFSPPFILQSTGLAPSGSSAPHNLLLMLSRWGQGENRDGKSARTRELRQRQFAKYIKSCMHKQMQARNSFVASHRQAGVQPLPSK